MRISSCLSVTGVIVETARGMEFGTVTREAEL
jgi:hypothetical protein